MFGIPDFWVYSAFILCVLSTLLCVIYGALNWNKEAENEIEEILEESKWEIEESKVVEKL